MEVSGSAGRGAAHCAGAEEGAFQGPPSAPAAEQLPCPPHATHLPARASHWHPPRQQVVSLTAAPCPTARPASTQSPSGRAALHPQRTTQTPTPPTLVLCSTRSNPNPNPNPHHTPAGSRPHRRGRRRRQHELGASEASSGEGGTRFDGQGCRARGGQQARRTSAIQACPPRLLPCAATLPVVRRYRTTPVCHHDPPRQRLTTLPPHPTWQASVPHE